MDMKKEKIIRNAALIAVMAAGLVMLCSCTVMSRRRLLKYAVDTYGECKLISEEHGGSGDDEYRTLYLRDKDTGIEYTVTSSITDKNASQTSDIVLPVNTSSDFLSGYFLWLLEETEDDLNDLSEEYGFEYEISFLTFVMNFDDPPTPGYALDALVEADGILEKYEIKGMRPTDFSAYTGDESVGTYNSVTGKRRVSVAYVCISE